MLYQSLFLLFQGFIRALAFQMRETVRIMPPLIWGFDSLQDHLDSNFVVLIGLSPYMLWPAVPVRCLCLMLAGRDRRRAMCASFSLLERYLLEFLSAPGAPNNTMYIVTSYNEPFMAMTS
jgi:hypothetical protein